MSMDKVLKTSVMAIAVLLAGCTSDYSGNKYEGATVGEVQRTEKGQVISLRKVELKPENSMTGTALGAVGGGLVGSAFGGGNAKLLTAAAGAVAGGIAGNAIASRTQDGVEYTVKEIINSIDDKYNVKLDSGAVITIAQAPTPPISVGQRVHVIYSQKGRSRVVPE